MCSSRLSGNCLPFRLQELDDFGGVESYGLKFFKLGCLAKDDADQPKAGHAAHATYDEIEDSQILKSADGAVDDSLEIEAVNHENPRANEQAKLGRAKTTKIELVDPIGRDFDVNEPTKKQVGYQCKASRIKRQIWRDPEADENKGCGDQID
jgi:hypothetical protein